MIAVTSVAWAGDSTVEVFTTAGLDPSDLPSFSTAAGVEIRVYRIDAIRQLEADLSRNLPVDARAAEREVLRRLRFLDAARKNDIQTSAEALLRAQELGIDRYPAIVVDGKFVAYGITDLESALAAYRLYERQTP